LIKCKVTDYTCQLFIYSQMEKPPAAACNRGELPATQVTKKPVEQQARYQQDSGQHQWIGTEF